MKLYTEEEVRKALTYLLDSSKIWQSYFTEPPIKDGKCEYFWTNNNYKLNNEKLTLNTNR